MRKIHLLFRDFVNNRRATSFAFCVLLSVMLWMLIKLSDEYRSTVQVSIEMTEVSEDQVLLESSADQLQVEIQSLGFRLLRYHWGNKKTLEIRLNNLVKEDSNRYYWLPNRHLEVLNQQFNYGEQITSVRPDTLFFVIEKKIRKKLPVVASVDLKYNKQYKPTKAMKLDPDSIELIGPEHAVLAFNEISTKHFVKKDIKSSFTQRLALKTDTNLNLSFSQNYVQLEVAVEEYTEGKQTVPITLVNVPDSVQLKTFPREVNLSYLVSLSAYKKITGSDFIVQCDYRQLIGQNPDLLKVKLMKYPEQIELLHINPSRVEYILSKKR